MGSTEEEVGFRLALKNRREVQHGINEVGDEFNRVGDQADRAGRKSRTAAGGMLAFGRSGKIAGRAVVTGFGAAAAGVVGTGILLTKLSKDSIGEAREAQKVGAITRAEIKATGRAANVSAREVGNLSGAISTKVGIDDEAIQSGANMILTFKNVRNEVGRGNRIFDRATKSAVDLSAAGFGSITSQSKTLAKALNDPLKGMAALGKSGVTFTQQQIDQVEAMVKGNDLLGAQKVILREVEAQVGGVAAAQATWGDKAAVSWGNIQESLGTALLPLLDRTQRWFVQEGGPALEGFVDIFERKGIPTIRRYAGIFEDRALPVISDLVDEAKPLAESILPAIGTGATTVADAFKVIAPRAKSVFDGFNGLPDWAKSAIAISVGAGVAAKKIGVNPFSLGRNAGASIASMAKPLPVYVVNNGVDVPGGSTPGGTPGGSSLSGKVLKYGGVLAIEAAAVTVGAEKMGEWLGNRPWKMPGRDPEYKQHLPQIIKAMPKTPVYTTLDPLTGLPTFRTNILANANKPILEVKRSADSLERSLFGVSKGMDRVDREVRPRVVLDGLEVQMARLDAFQSKLSALDTSLGAGQVPTRTPRVKKPGHHPKVEQSTFDDNFFGGDDPGNGSPRYGDVLLDGEKVGRVLLNGFEGFEARK